MSTAGMSQLLEKTLNHSRSLTSLRPCHPTRIQNCVLGKLRNANRVFACSSPTFTDSLVIRLLRTSKLFSMAHEDFELFDFWGERNWYSLSPSSATSQCTDIRDKVYGIQGLLPERLRFYPNYEVECHEVVFELVRKQVADRLAILDRQCSEDGYTQKVAENWRL
ncbi:hypothetical protein BU25DRAFT_221793 [Macroventuria anomochaeta]|uniref:Uncharacterized protein n=1 Tax=Macroventuria anomochaeta TaxID=301207 RepID=A0ACB6SCK6_9PLEO|nr:uncharacterized protein BU25DRAFT_221793 [Macroventuria anomochaeta]KAF2630984.1 hypothetical protein BU25DRAFT_221793 [Macroventuria anomochaeta]